MSDPAGSAKRLKKDDAAATNSQRSSVKLKRHPVPLNTSMAAQALWLVKVPKTLDELWQQADQQSVQGSIRVKQKSGAALPDFTLLVGKNETVPDSYDLKLLPLDAGQQIAFIKQERADKKQVTNVTAEMLGNVKYRAELRPVLSDEYLQLKRQRMEEMAKPNRQTMPTEGVKKFLPGRKYERDHKVAVMPRQLAAGGGSSSSSKALPKQTLTRASEEEVNDMLFAAFEQHEYYNIRDLQTITRQPMGYLKEIVSQLCEYITRAPHKATWRLKAEFRQSAERSSK